MATFHASYERSRAVTATAPVLHTALEKITGRIAVSDAARKTLVEHLGGDAVLIPNGVTVDRYAEAEPLARAGAPTAPSWASSAGWTNTPQGPGRAAGAFAKLGPERPDRGC